LLNTIIEGKLNNKIVNIDSQDLLTIIFGMIRMIVLEWRLSIFNFSLLLRRKNAIKSLDKLILKKYSN